MSNLKNLLSSKPNVEQFVIANKLNLDVWGIKKDAINSLEALTNLVLIKKAMAGDVTAKKYLDEVAGQSTNKINPKIKI